MPLKTTGETTQETPNPRELWALFESAEDLPTLPEVAVRLQRAVDDPKSSAKDIARIIEDDPAIATKVLKIVNSAFYSTGRGDITHLQPAIARLGFITVTNIALSTSIFQAFPQDREPIFDRREFWRHSISVGIVASVLYDYAADEITQPLTRDMVHLAGIVHDMGRILFERYAKTSFHQAVLSASMEDLPLYKEEARFLGMSHDEAGAWLAKKWKLGAPIHAAVRWHHDPFGCEDEMLRPLVKLIHMADYICKNQGMGSSGNACASYDYRIREELNLTSEKIADLMETVEAEASKSDILVSLTP